jgi:hypothetical protein
MRGYRSLTVTSEVSTLRPWLFASGNSSVVEHRLAKARVEGSNPFSRSSILPKFVLHYPLLRFYNDRINLTAIWV